MKKSKQVKDETQTMINSPPIDGNGNVTPRELGQLCYSLGDLEGNTVQILSYLLNSDHTVTEIANHVGLSDSATSQRLTKLKLHGFVDAKRGDNRTRIYSINPDTRNRIVNAVNQVFG